eukprot:762708-Hanusia_phi.AAC.12
MHPASLLFLNSCSMFFCSSSRQTYEIGQLTTSKLWRKPPSSTSTLHCRIQADDILRFGRVRYFAFGSNMNPGVMQGLRQVKPIKSCPGLLNLDAINLLIFAMHRCCQPVQASFQPRGHPSMRPCPVNTYLISSSRRSSLPSLRLSRVTRTMMSFMASSTPLLGDAAGLFWSSLNCKRSDWQKVARTEGVGFAYNLEEVVVHTYEGRKLQAVTLRTKPGLLRAPFGRDIPPSKGYLDLLIKGFSLISQMISFLMVQTGAEFYNLKEEYIDKLKSIQPNPAVFVNTKDMYDLLRINIGN